MARARKPEPIIMSNTAVNRQIVQEGLDRRAEERRDAALEAQARKLRIIINENHTAKTTPKQPEPIRVAKKAPDEVTFTRLNEKRAERAERAQEADECFAWYGLMLRVFGSALIAAFILSLSTSGLLPLWLTLPVAIAGFALSILTFAVWCFHNRNIFHSNLTIFE